VPILVYIDVVIKCGYLAPSGSLSAVANVCGFASWFKKLAGMWLITRCSAASMQMAWSLLAYLRSFL